MATDRGLSGELISIRDSFPIPAFQPSRNVLPSAMTDDGEFGIGGDSLSDENQVAFPEAAA